MRPLGVGEVLDGSISALRAQPKLMIGLSALVAVATQLLTVPITWLLLHDVGDRAFSFDEPTSTEQDVTFAASTLSAAGIQVVVTLAAALLLTGILTVAVSRAVLGEHLSASAAWTLARPRLAALLGVTVLVFLAVVTVLALAFVPGLLGILGQAPTGLVVLLFALGAPLGVAGAVYLYVAFALAPAAVVLEKSKVRASLRRSRDLVKGAWWRTFGILLLVNVLAQVLAGIVSLPFMFGAMLPGFFGSGNGSDFNPYDVVPLLITSVGTIAAAAITWPFTAVATALLYVDRRMRREGLDIELTRAAASRTDPRPDERG